MAYLINFEASNKADFIVDFSAIDADTNEEIDLTGASIAIKITDNQHCPLVDASTDNGLITLPSSSVFNLNIPVSRMNVFCAGSYHIGCVFELNDEINQIFVGNISVYDGEASV